MSRGWHCLAALLVLLVFWLLCDASFWRSRDFFAINENIQVAEAVAWWEGKLDIPERKWDSALYKGKVYSHFPPLFSFLSALVVPFYQSVPHWFVLLVVVLPIPVLSYLLVRKFTESAAWSAVLAIGLVCGTSALPVLEKCLRGAGPYFVNQALALSGVLIFLYEYFGRQRIAIAAAGVVAAVWARQMSVAYLVPLGWMAWERASAKPFPCPFKSRGHAALTPTLSQGGREACSTLTPAPLPGRERGLLRFAAQMALVVTLALGVPMGLNWLKFGSPFESGYMLIYEGRTDDVFANDARRHGIFSPYYLPRNLYYMNVGLPMLQPIERGEKPELYLAFQLWGTGIWWTTPILLLFFVDLRRTLADPGLRMLVVAALIVYIGLMVYHSTGYKQRGYNRYSLDFLPVLFTLAVPAALAMPRRRVLAVCLVAWSVFYFAGVRHWSQLRVW